MLSLRRIKSYVFASHWPRLAVQKQNFLFPPDSTWPPSDKDLLAMISTHLVCVVWQNYPGANVGGAALKFRKRKKIIIMRSRSP